MRSVRTTAGHWARLAGAALAVAAVMLPGIAITAPVAHAAPAPAGCAQWNNPDTSGLQTFVNNNQCVVLSPGTFNLAPNGVILPSGHSIYGSGREQTTLRATAGSWGGMNGMLRISPGNTSISQISALNLDAMGNAVIVVSGAKFTLSDSYVRNAKCNGVNVFGRDTIVRNNGFTGNGYGYTCATAPPGAGVYANKSPTWPTGNLQVLSNSFDRNGPALDVNEGFNGGDFSYNTVTNNSGWAGVSIFESYGWTVSNNTVRNPSVPIGGSGTGFQYSYNSPCNGGPIGARPAAIILCQASDADNQHTTNNRVFSNRASSAYGILLIGGDEAAPYNVPRFNSITSNIVTGSTYGCADDFRPGQWQDGNNAWSGNDCSQGYF